MNNDEIRRKKFETKRKIKKIVKPSEKYEKISQMRTIIEKWQSKATIEKVENDKAEVQGEKVVPDILPKVERGAKSVSRQSLRKVGSRSRTI